MSRRTKHRRLHRFWGRFAWYRRKLWSHAWFATCDVTFIFYRAKPGNRRHAELFGPSRRPA